MTTPQFSGNIALSSVCDAWLAIVRARQNGGQGLAKIILTVTTSTSTGNRTMTIPKAWSSLLLNALDPAGKQGELPVGLFQEQFLAIMSKKDTFSPKTRKLITALALRCNDSKFTPFAKGAADEQFGSSERVRLSETDDSTVDLMEAFLVSYKADVEAIKPARAKKSSLLAELTNEIGIAPKSQGRDAELAEEVLKAENGKAKIDLTGKLLEITANIPAQVRKEVREEIREENRNRSKK